METDVALLGQSFYSLSRISILSLFSWLLMMLVGYFFCSLFDLKRRSGCSYVLGVCIAAVAIAWVVLVLCLMLYTYLAESNIRYVNNALLTYRMFLESFWFQIQWASSISLFVLFPCAYLYYESSDLTRHKKKNTNKRFLYKLSETLLVFVLLSIVLFGIVGLLIAMFMSPDDQHSYMNTNSNDNMNDNNMINSHNLTNIIIWAHKEGLMTFFQMLVSLLLYLLCYKVGVLDILYLLSVRIIEGGEDDDDDDDIYEWNNHYMNRIMKHNNQNINQNNNQNTQFKYNNNTSKVMYIIYIILFIFSFLLSWYVYCHNIIYEIKLICNIKEINFIADIICYDTFKYLNKTNNDDDYVWFSCMFQFFLIGTVQDSCGEYSRLINIIINMMLVVYVFSASCVGLSNNVYIKYIRTLFNNNNNNKYQSNSVQVLIIYVVLFLLLSAALPLLTSILGISQFVFNPFPSILPSYVLHIYRILFILLYTIELVSIYAYIITYFIKTKSINQNYKETHEHMTNAIMHDTQVSKHAILHDTSISVAGRLGFGIIVHSDSDSDDDDDDDDSEVLLLNRSKSSYNERERRNNKYNHSNLRNRKKTKIYNNNNQHNTSVKEEEEYDYYDINRNDKNNDISKLLVKFLNPKLRYKIALNRRKAYIELLLYLIYMIMKAIKKLWFLFIHYIANKNNMK